MKFLVNEAKQKAAAEKAAAEREAAEKAAAERAAAERAAAARAAAEKAAADKAEAARAAAEKAAAEKEAAARAAADKAADNKVTLEMVKKISSRVKDLEETDEVVADAYEHLMGLILYNDDKNDKLLDLLLKSFSDVRNSIDVKVLGEDGDGLIRANNES